MVFHFGVQHVEFSDLSKPNMSNTISIGKVFFDLYNIDYFFETSGTASCGSTGIIDVNVHNVMSFSVSEQALNIEPIRSSANHESLQAKLHGGRSSRKSDL